MNTAFVDCAPNFTLFLTTYTLPNLTRNVFLQLLLLTFQLLPILTQSKNARPRRRPFLEPNASTQYPLLDQLALADNTWEAPNKVISATYRGDPDTGNTLAQVQLSLTH